MARLARRVARGSWRHPRHEPRDAVAGSCDDPAMSPLDRSTSSPGDHDRAAGPQGRSPVPASVGPLRVLATDPRGDPPAWIVVEKPSGMHSVASARSDGAPSVEAILRDGSTILATLEEAGLVHRLDRDTSGAMLVATSAEARARLRLAIANGSIRKTYVAGIAGDSPLAAAGEFRLRFSSRHRRSAKVTVRDRGDGEEGVCRWRTLGQEGARRLIEVELVGPGRRHQIRAGLAQLGSPLVGDALYGGVDASRLALHAARLVVEGTTIASALPEGFGR